MAYAASNGVSVVCTIPESLVMFYEWGMPIMITVSNDTKTAIPFLRSEFSAYNKQIWVDLGNKEQFIHPPGFGLTPLKNGAKISIQVHGGQRPYFIRESQLHGR